MLRPFPFPEALYGPRRAPGRRSFTPTGGLCCHRARESGPPREGSFSLWNQILCGGAQCLWVVILAMEPESRVSPHPCLGLGSGGARTMPCPELLAALRMRGHPARASSSPGTAHHPMPTHTTAELTANLRSVCIKRTDKQE